MEMCCLLALLLFIHLRRYTRAQVALIGSLFPLPNTQSVNKIVKFCTEMEWTHSFMTLSACYL